MTDVRRLDTPRRNPTANRAISRADRNRKAAGDRQVVRDAAKTAEAFIHATAQNSLRAILMRGDQVISTTQLPEYGETLIVTHDAKVKTVTKSVKEKVE